MSNQPNHFKLFNHLKFTQTTCSHSVRCDECFRLIPQADWFYVRLLGGRDGSDVIQLCPECYEILKGA